MKKRISFKHLAVVVFILLTLVMVPAVYAFDWREGNEIVIGAAEIIDDDLYVAADTFILEGTVDGDLIVIGQKIIISGTVTGDLYAAGQHVIIAGSINDDARITGAVLEIKPQAVIGDDLLAAGYSLDAQADSQIEGTVAFGGKQALLAGSIAEDVFVGSYGLAITGEIDGNVTAEVASQEEELPVDPFSFMSDMPAVPTVAAGLNLDDAAKIGGELEYTTSENIKSPETDGEDGSDRPDRPSRNSAQRFRRPARSSWLARGVRRLVALVLIGLLVISFVPAWVTHPSEKLNVKPWQNLGWGVAVYLCFPIIFAIVSGALLALAGILGVITLGNLSIAVLLLGACAGLATLVIYSLTVFYLTKMMVGYFVGQAVLKQLKAEWCENHTIVLITGLSIIGILISIPVLGGVLRLAITIFGLGTLFVLLREKLFKKAE